MLLLTSQGGETATPRKVKYKSFFYSVRVRTSVIRTNLKGKPQGLALIT